MKKFLCIIILFALIVGAIIGIKTLDTKSNIETYENNEELEEIYIDEINLPVSNVDTFNPLRTKNNNVLEVMKFIYEPLFEFKSNDEIESVLANDYAKLDSKTWIITLKDNIIFHGGEIFSADDVLFTIQKLNDDDLIFSDNVKNIFEIQKIDEFAVKILLNNPDDFFISKLTFPIIPEYYFKGNGFYDEEKAKRMIGTGPYMYDSRDENIIKLVFNNKWWKSSDVKLKKINIYEYDTYGEAIKGFKSSEVDMIVTNMTNWKDKFGTIGSNSYSFENSEYEVIVPNCKNNILSNNSVRRAILQGINRENIINSVYYDNAITSDLPFHVNSKFNVLNFEYDIEKAKQILINDGWLNEESSWRKNGEVLNFSLLVDENDAEKVSVANIIKENLEEIEIHLSIIKTSKKDLVNRLNDDDFELALVAFDIKNEFFVNEFISQNGKYNYANFYSEKIEELIQKIKQSDEIYKENINFLLQELKNDAPYIGLFFKTSTILTNKSVKGNFEPTWSNFYRNITSFCK